jgi:hypothetical protein
MSGWYRELVLEDTLSLRTLLFVYERGWFSSSASIEDYLEAGRVCQTVMWHVSEMAHFRDMHVSDTGDPPTPLLYISLLYS